MDHVVTFPPGVAHHGQKPVWPPGLWQHRGRDFRPPAAPSLPGPRRTGGRRAFRRWWESRLNIQPTPRRWRDSTEGCWLEMLTEQRSCAVVNAGEDDADGSKLADVPASKRRGVKRPQPKLDSQRYLGPQPRLWWVVRTLDAGTSSHSSSTWNLQLQI